MKCPLKKEKQFEHRGETLTVSSNPLGSNIECTGGAHDQLTMLHGGSRLKRAGRGVKRCQ